MSVSPSFRAERHHRRLLKYALPFTGFRHHQIALGRARVRACCRTGPPMGRCRCGHNHPPFVHRQCTGSMRVSQRVVASFRFPARVALRGYVLDRPVTGGVRCPVLRLCENPFLCCRRSLLDREAPSLPRAWVTLYLAASIRVDGAVGPELPERDVTPHAGYQ
jgi:hypothetical protein